LRNSSGDPGNVNQDRHPPGHETEQKRKNIFHDEPLRQIASLAGFGPAKTAVLTRQGGAEREYKGGPPLCAIMDR
jgi:hypothetical protein